jgi:hypothetical protein
MLKVVIFANKLVHMVNVAKIPLKEEVVHLSRMNKLAIYCLTSLLFLRDHKLHPDEK